ncbi:glycosyltransferase family 9 protein [Candidatus Sumerlaeota bacterium]|nr:glycosyltransferase family 9 protein [Candidatus Sumerlaeota bacterium]
MSDSEPREIQPPGFPVRYDCRHYTGYRPCGISPVCDGCEHCDPVGRRILIIKLGAMGDVVRTTPVLTSIRREWPNAHVTWITEACCRDLLKSNPLIDRLLTWGFEAITLLEAMRFDLILNFEKDPAALALGERVEAAERRGFRLTSSGSVGIADERAGYALQLGIDDNLKFHVNTKPVQQVVCEMVGLEWSGDLYLFEAAPAAVARCTAFESAHPALQGRALIGVSTGCGPGFPTKRWTVENVVGLLRGLLSHPRTEALLLGGEREREFNREILGRVGDRVIDGGCDNSFDEFVGLLMACDAVVSTDSMPMHLAVAVGKPVVALFGPTTAREVELGPRSEKVITDLDCSPCYLTSCPKTDHGGALCMERMGPEPVLDALGRLLSRADGAEP